MALTVDWANATVSPTATGLLWVEVKLAPRPEGAESEALSKSLGELSEGSEPVVGVHLRGDLIRLHITPRADVAALKRALAAKLDEFADQSEQRTGRARARHAAIEAKRSQAEASASELQSQFRMAPG